MYCYNSSECIMQLINPNNDIETRKGKKYILAVDDKQQLT